MESLNISHFRSFGADAHIRLAPITVLLGENSAGKTSLMAAIRIAYDVLAGQRHYDFNEAPFNLGSFRTIATSGRGLERAPSFSIGCTQRAPGGLQDDWKLPSEHINVTATFKNDRGKSYLASWTVQCEPLELRCELSPGSIADGNSSPFIRLTLRDGATITLDKRTQLKPFHERMTLWHLIANATFEITSRKPIQGGGEATEGKFLLPNSLNILFSFNPSLFQERPVAFAPLRALPKRTYDVAAGRPSSSGEHVPHLLHDLSIRESSAFGKLSERIAEFGQQADLFERLSVKRLSREPDEPFQLITYIDGIPRNLADIGYGVSQALPMIVESLSARNDSLFLVQQPEVHLHPKAQASLASFFLSLYKREHKRFVIETHSDYIVDRLRVELGAGAISTADIAIYFLQKEDSVTTIHPITLSQTGDIIDCPRGYREFFLAEQRRLLGF